LEAWCLYHLDEYTGAFAAVCMAGNDQRGLRCKLHLYAYKKTGFQDKTKMLEVAKLIEDKVAVANAFAIIARDLKDTAFLSHEDVCASIAAHVAGKGIAVAHLLHNAARVYHDWCRGPADYLTAIGLLTLAIEHYGDGDNNLAHRATACYWWSQCLEKLGDIAGAKSRAHKALMLRENQISFSPDDPGAKKARDLAQANWDRLRIM
jgi:hypothetical protein